MGVITYANSGRTDANGGHRDNKNKSGLGSYHYHCGGHPPHLYTDGVCPYLSGASSTSSNSFTSSGLSYSSNEESSLVEVTNIEMSENVGDIEVGESRVIIAKIIPDNASDKNIIWKSSD